MSSPAGSSKSVSHIYCWCVCCFCQCVWWGVCALIGVSAVLFVFSREFCVYIFFFSILNFIRNETNYPKQLNFFPFFFFSFALCLRFRLNSILFDKIRKKKKAEAALSWFTTSRNSREEQRGEKKRRRGNLRGGSFRHPLWWRWCHQSLGVTTNPKTHRWR